MTYAINYTLGRDTEVITVDAPDADTAYSEARWWLVRRSLHSAALQGCARAASQDDIDRAKLNYLKIEASRSGAKS